MAATDPTRPTPPGAAPTDFASTARRRDEVTEQVRRWCSRAHISEREIGGAHPDLSDDAAVVIAAGYLDEPVRQVLAARRRAGRAVPSIGGFAELRLVSDEHARVTAALAATRSPLARALLRLRQAELARRLRAMRDAVVVSDKHYAKTVRAARRERRDGIHLDPAGRAALFQALRRTPAPSLRRGAGGQVGRSPGALAERLAAALAGGGARRAGAEAGSFADPYDTLLYLAGNLYDRIGNSPAWHSGHFAAARAQLLLPEELGQIAVDTAALRAIAAELTATDPGGDRLAALVPVWDQLVERVAALARIGDLLTLAEERLATVETATRAAGLDGRIDELVGSSQSGV